MHNFTIRTVWSGALLLVAGLPGCAGATPSGSSGNSADAAASFPGAPLSTFTTAARDLKIELRMSPVQPVHVGPGGVGELRVFDTSTGAPVDGLSIAATCQMPVMGHRCSPVPIQVEPKGHGVYVLTPFGTSMPGVAQVELILSRPLPDGGQGRAESAVSPTFDVTG
jgi:hypothetical protein